MYRTDRIIGQLYGIDDFVIIPEAVTDIDSRTEECNAKYPANDDIEYEHYGIFTAPMTPVVGVGNYKNYQDNGVVPIIPRTTPIAERMALKFDTFIAMGKKEFWKELVEQQIEIPEGKKLRVCVDVANGHMKTILAIIRKAKDIYKDNIVIMAGNIANPKVYKYYAQAGISYIRCGIGSGNVCTTAANTGVHYPLGSLILGCVEERENMKMRILSEKRISELPKIVADGGFRNFDQINKAYALGADYVMLGELFARTDGGCGNMYLGKNGVPIHSKQVLSEDEISKFMNDNYIYPYNLLREYYGMSTKKAQMEMGKSESECRTSEGIVKYVEVKYTLRGWLDNMEHYLKSAMSYCSCRKLEDFIGSPIMGYNSQLARAAFYK